MELAATRSKVNPLHLRAVDERGPEAPSLIGEEVFKAPPIDLVRGNR
jgi:hypothetical protein